MTLLRLKWENACRPGSTTFLVVETLAVHIVELTSGIPPSARIRKFEVTFYISNLLEDSVNPITVDKTDTERADGNIYTNSTIW
jgi:hypothetical protein